MLRALSTRRSHGRYEKLVDKAESSSAGLLGGSSRDFQLKRSNTLPIRFLGCCRGSNKVSVELNLPSLPAVKPAMKVNKSHPLFTLFDRRRQNRRTTSRPEFARYIEYVKEAGLWDKNSGMPVMYYK
ncbi:unnamed protein product [Linum tenue]|uniref:Uncharacterized protein n=1 Tax=Linum tenue TaxID=586396 RepID=A0AAV0K8E0_9ROSI|nr:unnamed protein product [Linum tenue]